MLTIVIENTSCQFKTNLFATPLYVKATGKQCEPLAISFVAPLPFLSTSLKNLRHLPETFCVILLPFPLSQAREVYRPVAAEASLMYFMLLKLSTVDSMYQYSLDSFTR